MSGKGKKKGSAIFVCFPLRRFLGRFEEIRKSIHGIRINIIACHIIKRANSLECIHVGLSGFPLVYEKSFDSFFHGFSSGKKAIKPNKNKGFCQKVNLYNLTKPLILPTVLGCQMRQMFL